MPPPSTCLNDDSLGPFVQGCRGNLDFTVRFEQIFLSIVPAGAFVALSVARMAILFRRSRIIQNAAFGFIKVSLLAILAALQLALLITQSICCHGPQCGLSVAATASAFIAGTAMMAFSWAEHVTSPRPSMALQGYLVLTLIFDGIQARTWWLAASRPWWYGPLFMTSMAVKGLSLVVEAQQKSKWLAWDIKEHSPEEWCGIFGLASYSWLYPLLLLGSKTFLSNENLYALDKELTAEAAEDLEPASYWERKSALTSPGRTLAWIIAKQLAIPFFLPVVPRIALIGFSFAQPFFIGALLGFLQHPAEPPAARSGNLLIGAGALIYLAIAFSSALYSYYQVRAICMVRSCLGAAVYKKATEMAPMMELDGSSSTASLTLMSTDVERVARGLLNIHEIWACMIELGLGLYLLHQQLGEAFLASVVTFVACTVVMLWLLRWGRKQQRLWMSRIQDRVGLTATVLANMKSIKMSGMTDCITGLVQPLRISELAAGRKWRAFLVVAASLAQVPSTLTPAAVLTLAPEGLEASRIFTAISYLVLLSAPIRLCQALPSIQSAFICLGRIQRALACEPRRDFRRFALALESGIRRPDNGHADTVIDLARKLPNQTERFNVNSAVSIVNGSFSWTAERMVLRNITATIPARKITMITGPVASGKSTFCKALLGEVPVAEGDMMISPSCKVIGFCDQNPFLLNTMLKENIVGYSDFDALRYKEVLKATELDIDVALFPAGHDTKAGSNGIMLSGGQRQRVSLARALYLRSNFLVIDDIFSSLDARTAEQVFQATFGPDGIIRTRCATAVLCTNSASHLSLADHVIVFGSDGHVVAEGSFQQVKGSCCLKRGYDGKFSGQPGSHSLPPSRSFEPGAAQTQELETCVAAERQVGSSKIYRYYFNQTSVLSVLIVLLAGTLFGSMANFPTVWLSYWSEDSFNRSRAFYVGIYTVLQVSALAAFTGGAATVLVMMVANIGARLHKTALLTVTMATLTFYTNTDLGSVLNHFSQDLTIIDGELPLALINVCFSGFEVVGMAIVITLASPYIAIGYPPLLAMLYGVQKLYLRTSRQLRLLDLEAKSPLYSHFLDTTTGLPTIRASGWAEEYIAHNKRLLNASQRPAYLLVMVQQWLALTLRLVATIVATTTITLATQLAISKSFAGASLVTLISFASTATSVIENYTLLEVSIGAVSRLKTFSDEVVPETLPEENIIPLEDWPQAGAVEIKDVTAISDNVPRQAGGSGSPNPALKNLTLSIEPGEKIALCGRTGSGKSSIILLLLALLDPAVNCAQNLSIDGIPIHRINRAELRKRIIAVPQDPVFLPAGNTIKANLDPFDAASDEDCVAVLETVRLGSLLHEGAESGLRRGISADTLSAGQQRLFGLARAILRHRLRTRGNSIGEKEPNRGGLLLLDEVNFAADKETEKTTRRVLEQEFAMYTVIMVSHHLEMVVEMCQRVVVLENGMIVEIGDPRQLIGSVGSRFGDLWNSQGGASVIREAEGAGDLC
ncbi:ABC transporter [Xylaria scruposa]|nr:ABC transporter [Xylaria scruposa]